MSYAFTAPAPVVASLRTTSSALCLRSPLKLQPCRLSRSTLTMHGPAPTTATPDQARRPGQHKGFVEEMRRVAMRLHTKDQAPREGEQETSALPIDAWAPTKQHFMQFLVDSRAIYKYFETELVRPDSPNPMFTTFTNTGLERVESLEKDMHYLNTLGVETPQPTGAATNYIAYMQKLLKEQPESVVCHWYNYYFAHSAGGRMIGRLMQDRLFNGHEFEFYKWESDVKPLLNAVRAKIDVIAAEWSRDLKDECLKETSLAFGYSGTVLQNLAKAG